MYERSDGTWQISTKFPEWKRIEVSDIAEKQMRTLNRECVFRIAQTLRQDSDPIGSDEHPWDGDTTTLSVRIKEDSIVEQLREVVSDANHSVDQEAKYRIIEYPL